MQKIHLMKRSIALIISFILISTIATAGGGWTQKKGQGFYKLSEWWVVFDKHYTDVGLTDPNLTTGVFNTNLYIEHGLSDRLTGLLNASLFSRNYMNNLVSSVTNGLIVEGDEVNSLGDIDLGIKYGITTSANRIAVAASLLLGVPTGKDVAGKQSNLQTGDGEFNQLIRVDAGTGLYSSDKLSTYANVYAGFNNRTEGFSDEYRYGAELGIGVLDKRLWIAGKLNIVESLKNGNDATSNMATSIFANNTEYASMAFELSGYVTKRIGLSASTAGAFSGELIAAAPSYSVGIFYDTSR